MRGNRGTARVAGLLAALATTSLQACTGYAPKAETEKLVASSSERDCLIRAMYFESNRSSRDGLMAVGTVVMNRMASPVYPNTLAAARPKPGVMQWLYATFAEAQPSKSCDQTASAFGATSLACEDEHAGR